MKQPLYNDRGMMKWQGLILSEHREVLDRLKEQYTREYIPPIQMETDEIQAILRTAYLEHYKVWIALNQIDPNGIYFEMEGSIRGFDGNDVMVDEECVRLDSIRAIEFVERLKFWQVSME